MGRRVRLAVLAGAGLLLLLVIERLTYPLWAPALIASQLPDGWRLNDFEAGTHNLFTSSARRMKVKGQVAGLSVEASLIDLEVEHRGPKLQIGALTVSLQADLSGETGDDADEAWVLPRLALPGDLPFTRIDELELSLGPLDRSQTLQFSKLSLGAGAAQTHLDAQLETFPYLLVPGSLHLQFEDDALELAVNTAGHEGRKLLYFRQDKNSAEAVVDLDLGWLDTAELPGSVGFSPSLSGRIIASLGFAGTPDQRPVSASVKLDGVRAEIRNVPLEIDALTECRQTQGGLGCELPEFEGRASVPAEWLSDWVSRAQDAGVSGLAGVAVVDLGVSVLQPITADVSWDGEGSWELRGPMAVKIRQQDSWNALIRLQEAAGKLAGAAVTRASGSIEASGESVLDARLDAARFRFESPSVKGSFNSWPGLFRFEGIAEGSGLKVWSVGEDALVEAASFKVDGKAVLAQETGLSGDLHLFNTSFPGAGVRADRLDLDIRRLSLPGFSGQLQANTHGLQIDMGAGMRDGSELELVINPAAEVVSGTGSLTLQAATVPFRYTLQVSENLLDVTLDPLSLPAAGLLQVANLAGVDIPTDIQVQSGTVDMKGEARLALGSGILTGAINLESSALGISLYRSQIRDMEMDIELDLSDPLTITGSIGVAQFELAAGLDLEGVKATLWASAAGDIAAQGLGARLLDGNLQLAETRIINGILQPTTAAWSEFDLDQLFRFLDVSGLEGSGRVTADLPLSASSAGVSISGGGFRSAGRGVIRYRGPAPATNVGLRALENFLFESLDGTIDYSADGAYTIGVVLNGHNPDLYGGHPVRFRLNLNGELPAAFRSLFLTGDFSKAILDRLSTGTGDSKASQ